MADYTVAFWQANQSSLDSGPSFNILDTAANISAALDALNGDPDISVIKISDNLPVNLNVAQLNSDATAISILVNANSTPAALKITDTAANIGANFATLNQQSQITSIVVSDNAPVQITASQVANDSHAIGELINANTSAATVVVKDSAANVAANFDAIQAAGAVVTSVIVSNSQPLTLTAAQIVTDTGALAKVVNNNAGPVTFNVSDTAANITANLDALQGTAHIGTITVSDNGAIAVTVAQMTSDSGALGELVNANATPYTLAVTDTAAHIVAALDTLGGNSHVAKIVVSDSATNQVTVSVAQLTSDATAIADLFQANGTTPATVTVVDTAAAVGGALDAISANTHVGKIDVSDSATNQVSVSVAQLTSDAAALSHLFKANGTTQATVTVNDTAAHVTAGLDSLGGNSQVNKIVVSDSGSNEVNVSIAQLTSDATALGELFAANGTTPANVSVTDTAANISTALGSLNGNTQVNKIIISDSATNAVTVSVAGLTADATALGELFLANGSTHATVTTLDTAANISAAIDSLSGNSQVNKIVVSDSAGHQVSVTVAQLTSDATGLAELFQANGTTAAHVTVTDTAAHVSAAIATLDSSAQVNAIVISDNAPLTLNAGQVVADPTALGEITNQNATPYTITVSDVSGSISHFLDGLQANGHVTKIVVTDSVINEVLVSVAQLTSDATVLADLFKSNGTTPATITVSDTAAAITTALNSLNSNTQVDKVIVSDSGTNAVTVSVAQITSDATVLGELFQSNGTTPAKVTVNDTAAHVTTALDALSANGQVTKIVVSDSATNAVTVTVAQITSDATALAELFKADGTTHATVTVGDTAAHVTTAIDALSANTQVTKIVVSDSATNQVVVKVAQITSDAHALSELFKADGTTAATVTVQDNAAHITTGLDALSANTQVNKIVISNSASAAVTVSVAQITSDAHALAELFNSNGTTPAKVTVSDTAAHVTTALDALSGNTQVTKIVVSDSASNAVSVTVAQITSDATALAELFKADGTTHALVTVGDTAAHVTAALDALSANTQVNKIVLSDSATNQVTVTVAQLTSDATALGELFQANGTSAAPVTVSDTAAHIQAAFDGLSGNSQVDKIVVSNGAEVTITAAQAGADGTALGELFQSDGVTAAHVAVLDTAANISGAIAALNGNSHVDKIVVSDSGSNEVTLTAAQAAADSTALGELFLANGTTPAHVKVSDSAANISGAFDALNTNSHVDKIVVSDSGSNEVTLTVAQVASDGAALAELFLANGTTPAHVAVSDTAANISAGFNALNNTGNVDKIIVSDSGSNEVIITAAQAGADSAALGELFQADGTTPGHVEVLDTVANITAAFGALSGNGHVDKIVVSDSALREVVVNTGQLTSNAAGLAKLFEADGVTHAHVTVADNAAPISAGFDALSADSQVNKIIVADSGSNAVVVNVAQITSDATALAELFQADGTTPAHVTVTDTAAHIAAALGALNADGQVNRIVISNNASITLSASAAASDSTALGELVNANATPVSLKVSDSAAQITLFLDALNAITNIVTILISNNQPLTLTAAQVSNDSSALGKLANKNGSGVTINVVDTAAHISAHLDALNALNDLASITVSDSAPITVTVAQIASDSVILSELQNQNGHPIVLTVEDTAANILANIASLQQNTQITAIVISDNAPLTLSVAQLSADAGALAEMSNANATPYQLIISDNAANISSALDSLNGNSHVNSISVTNNSSLTVTVAQITSDATALSKTIDKNGSPYTLTVTDTAAHISAGLDGVNTNSHVTKIVVSDSGSNAVSVSVAQLTSDATALGELFQSDGTTPAHVTVSDSAAHVTAALDSLNGNTQVTKIVVSDSGSNAVSVSVAQLTSDATALAELFQSNGTTPAKVTVTDTAANVSTALNSLNGNTQVTKIVVSDSATNEITVSVAGLTADATALGELFQAGGTATAQIHVQDTAANITTALDSLGGNAQVNGIIVSDSGSNEVVATVAQLTSDAAALAELFQSNGTTPAHVKVSDTAAHISSNFNALNGNAQVDSIVISNNAALSLSASQVAGDTNALAETVNQNASSIVINVTDTAAAITTNLDALQANGHVAKIVVSDSGSNEVRVSIAQLTSDSAALADLFQSNGTTPAKVAVFDTGAHVSAALDALNGNTQVDKIIVSDNSAVSLSIAQLTSDAAALGELINGNGSVTSLNVVDTAANIASNLNALEANTHISTVTISDNAPISISVATLVADADVVSALVNANATPVQVTVTDTAANIAANFATLNQVTQVTSIVISDNATLQLSASQLVTDVNAVAELSNQNASAVSIKVKDTAANISANFSAIDAAGSVITSIVVSNNGALTLTATIAIAESSTLAKVINNNGSPYTLNIVDFAANVASNLNQLEANSSHIVAITFTDGTPPTITVTQAQQTADADLLAKIVSAYNLTVTGVTGQAYTSFENFYAAGGVLNYTTQFNTDGSITDLVNASGLRLVGTSHADNFTFSSGTSETVIAGSGDDKLHFGANFAANDHINGGNGSDVIILNGDYTGGNALTFSATTLTGVERFTLLSGHNYVITTNDANVAAGATLTVSASSLGGTNSLAFDGSAETNGRFILTGGAGNDSLTGGAGKDVITGGNGTNHLAGGLGADSLTGGNGADTFVYSTAADSTGANRDTVHGFDASADFFQFSSSVTGIDATVTSGKLGGATFDANLAHAVGAGQLAADHAVLFTPTSGSLAGHTFLVVDLNGVAGYQSGADVVVDITGAAHLGSLTTANFITPV